MLKRSSDVDIDADYCKPELISWWWVNMAEFYMTFLSQTGQKCTAYSSSINAHPVNFVYIPECRAIFTVTQRERSLKYWGGGGRGPGAGVLELLTKNGGGRGSDGRGAGAEKSDFCAGVGRKKMGGGRGVEPGDRESRPTPPHPIPPPSSPTNVMPRTRYLSIYQYIALSAIDMDGFSISFQLEITPLFVIFQC